MEILPVDYLVLIMFFTLLEFMFVSQSSAICNIYSGPSGLVECVKLSRPVYNGSQWATCVTDAYMKLMSKGQHACVDRTTYCWYQCMLESHNIFNGNVNFPSPVYDDCACGDGKPIPTTTLPPLCFSPNGQDCSWYNDCLEKRHPCEGTAAAYAVTYAETFCKLYENHAPRFSQTGQKWTNAVRMCLQVTLVPILRPWVNISCDGIRQIAFKSHSDCYTFPYPGEPSICDLPVKDWWEIFWTIKSAFTSTFVESLQGAVNILSGCGKLVFENHVDMIKLEFHILQESRGSTSDILDEWAGYIADAIGSKLGWNDAGVMWYAYSNSSNNSNTIPVYVLVTGKSTYNLNNIQNTNVNLTSLMDKVVKAVQNGDLLFSQIGNKSEPIYVQQMKACSDFACIITITQVFTKDRNNETSDSTANVTISLIDINDNSPEINKSSTTISAWKPGIGDVIGKMPVDTPVIVGIVCGTCFLTILVVVIAYTIIKIRRVRASQRSSGENTCDSYMDLASRKDENPYMSSTSPVYDYIPADT